MSSSLPLSKRQAKRLRRNVLTVSITLLALFLLGVLLIVCRNGLHSFCSGVLWALGCMTIGWLVGFLFGLPRVHRTVLSNGPAPLNKDGRPEGVAQKGIVWQEDSNSFGLDTNANLEEISDWLTKMLVGIGLTELRSVPADLGRAGAYVGQSLGPDSGMKSTGSSIIVYFLSLGFLGGFLVTRMYLGPAFRRADHSTNRGEQDSLERLAENQKMLANEAQVDRMVAGAIDELAKKDKPDTPLLPARISDLINLLEKHSRLFPLKRTLHLVLARLYVEGRNDYDVGMATLTRFVEEKLKAGEKDLNVADAFFNIACYCSLQMSPELDSAKRKVLENKGVESIRRSIAINSENIEDFKTDPDLKNLWDSEGGRAIRATLDGDGSPPSE